MEPSENRKFTASDIARYHTGKMPAEERHALEKAALEDPLLADALEGYAYDPAPAAALASLQKRLDEKTHPNRPANVTRLYRVLSVAAMLVVLAGTGWFAWKAFEDARQNRSIARQQEKPAHKNHTAAPVTIDTVNSVLQDSTNAPAETANNITSQKGDTSMPAPPAQPLAKDEVPDSRMAIDEVPVKPAEKEMVPDSPGVAGAEVKETTMAARKMASVQAFEAPKDSIFSGFAKSRAGNDTINNFDVTLQAQKTEPPEVVVVGRSGAELAGKYPHVVIDTLEPAEGYTNFDDYVAANIKTPDELRDKTTSGEVQLSFDVNEEGQPVNITVVKSLCDQCDKEAIRLLKEGPRWKKQKNKKGKITIRF